MWICRVQCMKALGSFRCNKKCIYIWLCSFSFYINIDNIDNINITFNQPSSSILEMKFSTIITLLSAGIAMASPTLNMGNSSPEGLEKRCNKELYAECTAGCSELGQGCINSCCIVRYPKGHIV